MGLGGGSHSADRAGFQSQLTLQGARTLQDVRGLFRLHLDFPALLFCGLVVVTKVHPV